MEGAQLFFVGFWWFLDQGGYISLSWHWEWRFFFIFLILAVFSVEAGEPTPYLRRTLSHCFVYVPFPACLERRRRNSVRGVEQQPRSKQPCVNMTIYPYWYMAGRPLVSIKEVHLVGEPSPGVRRQQDNAAVRISRPHSSA